MSKLNKSYFQILKGKNVAFKEELLALQDISYADFQAKLTPNIPRDLFIGVRGCCQLPKHRKIFSPCSIKETHGRGVNHPGRIGQKCFLCTF